MCEFLKKIGKFLSSLLGNGARTNISGRNSTNINGNINVNIHIENITVGSKVKITSNDQTFNFIVASVITKEIQGDKYTVLNIINLKENSTDILFIKGDFPSNQNIDLKATAIDSQDKIKGGNYYLKRKEEENHKKD